MANKYAGTQTEKNLEIAFAGESQARNKYTYFASKAKKEGFEQIAALFLKTADNEKEHAKLWYKELHDGIGDTADCLLKAAEGENYEWTDMYAGFAETAEKEGRIPRVSSPLPYGSRGRETPRRALPRTAPQRGGARGIQEIRCEGMGVPQLRTDHGRRGSTCYLPRMRPSAGLLRGACGELLNN